MIHVGGVRLNENYDIKSLLPLDGHLQFQAQGSGVQVFFSSWLTQNISPTMESKLNTHSPLITFHFQVEKPCC